MSTSHINQENLEIASGQLWQMLYSKIQYLPKNDQKLVEMAFVQMVLAHGEIRRKSGEFYIIHPVMASLTLTDFGLDKDTLAACLLHDVPEDTKVTLKEIQKDFGAEIAFLVEGVTKLSQVKYQGQDRYAENLRRMFVAMSQDLRVIFIKLADRLHNLQTLKFVKEEKQRRIAMESLEIYAPIAERLGMAYFRGAIEDACFPYLYPDIYKKFVADSDLIIEKRQKILAKVTKKTEKILTESGLKYLQILGRAKKYFSIYRKTQDKNYEIDQINDLVALRVITDSVENCYEILAKLHQYFEPVPNRIKDYITRPKVNGYQSLHTTVKDVENDLIFEIQIRTSQMNDFAEYGVASHWAYKEQKGKTTSKKEQLENIVTPETYKWLSELIELGQENWSEEEYLSHVKLDLFQDRIFVMTPKNDAIDLPIGATALDFAYKIHNKVGEQASMATVNGEMVKLSSKLKNGDVVKILTDKRQKPNDKWLQWVVTTQASKQIRTFLKKNKSA